MFDYFNICDKYHISFNELLFIKMILITQNEDNNALSNAYFKLHTDVRGSIKEMIEHLQQINIISKTFKIPNPGEKLNVKLISINKNFIKSFYKSSFYLGKELFEEFPLKMLINGSHCVLKRVSKHFNSLEDFYEYYGKIINWNPEKHSEILELVRWGKKNNLIQWTLSGFVVDRGWESLQQLKNELETIPTNIVIDSGKEAEKYVKNLLTLN